MPRLRIALLTGLLAATVGMLAAQDKDAEGPVPAGSWKVTLPTRRETKGEPILVVRLEKAEGGWKGKVVASSLEGGKSTLEKVSVRDKVLRFTVKTPIFTLPCAVKLPADKAPSKLYGEAMLRRSPMPIELERTTLTSLDDYEQYRELLAKEPLGVQAYSLALALLSKAAEKKVKPAEARAWAEKAVKSAELYGPGVQRSVLLGVASTLSAQKGLEKTAVQYARRAERQLDEKETLAAQKQVLSVLADVLERAGKEDEATAIRAKIKKFDFSIKPKTFAGRKGKSRRVVLGEMFTNAHASPCQAAGMMEAALLKSFKPAELAVVEYHEHTNQPDPLACPESEERMGFYGREFRAVPALMLSGKVPVGVGGGPEDAQERYDDCAEAIEAQLEEPAGADLTLKATRKGDKVTIVAEAARVPAKGDDIRLRVVLAEATVKYKGGNGLTVHRNVARMILGGVEGTVLKTKTSRKTFTVDLADLRKKLDAYLDKVKAKHDFPDKQRPMELKNLRVIGFIQNDGNGEVLQAAQVDVK